MVIRVGNERVYKFSENSAIVVEVHDGYAQVLVLPERRRFLADFGDATRAFVADEIERQLSEGCLHVSEEVLS